MASPVPNPLRVFVLPSPHTEPRPLRNHRQPITHANRGDTPRLAKPPPTNPVPMKSGFTLAT